jgi:hypothetical protein
MVWKSLQAHTGLELPPLQLSDPDRHSARLIAWGGWLMAAGSALVIMQPQTVGQFFGLLAVLAPLVIGCHRFAEWLLQSRAVELDQLATVSDLVLAIVGANLKRLRTRYGIKPNRDEIFATVKHLLVEHCGVDPAKVSPDAILTTDLGLC